MIISLMMVQKISDYALPVLNRYDIKGTFFICSSPYEKRSFKCP